jgi:hypothetical protein
MYRDPLPDAPDGRLVILQEAIGDCQVPNMTTEMLARAIGVNLMTPSDTAVYGLPTITSPTTEPALGQVLMPDRLADYTPPEENIPPTEDNGVHSDMCFLPNVLDQVTHLLHTGEIIQYCNGPCDPD